MIFFHLFIANVSIFFRNFQVSDYFHHLILEGNLNQFEQAVVRIPVDRQDIHYVMKTCRSNRLYDGVIYIFNKALCDYISPLEVSGDHHVIMMN